MTIPPIKQNSKIRIISPAGKVNEKYVLPAVDWLKDQGYQVELGTNVFAQHFQFAGTDAQRLEDVQMALDNPDCDVILCSRGGYGTVRIIDQLDFTAFRKNPKWLIGFSDITILHAALNKQMIPTIHGAMPRHFFNKNNKPNENLKSIMELLKGKKVKYIIPASGYNRTGKVTAELTGGNLSIISSLQGTKYELDTDGKILFLEDIDEFLYHSDRMIRQLKLAGKLGKLAGLILGDFTEMKDNESPFGKTIHEIITEAVQEYDYPVCFGFPAGHDKKNLALTFGKKWKLKVSQNASILKIES